MKTTDTAPPPELAAKFAEFVSPAKAGATGATVQKTRKRVRKPPKPKKIAHALSDARQLAQTLASYIGYDLKAAGTLAWCRAREQALLRGEIEPDFWQPVPPTSTAYYLSVPSQVPHPNPPPYAYRDPLNMPTLVSYPDAIVTEGPPRTYGKREGIYWSEKSLVWRHHLYQTPPVGNRSTRPPLFVLLSGNIRVDTNARASRPMLSLVCRAIRGTFQELDPLAVKPPLVKHRSHYWRYKVIDSQPPYFHADAERHIIQRIPDTIAGGPPPYVAVSTAPRPMLGKGFNNNTEVTTVWQGEETLYGPDVCLSQNPSVATCDQWGTSARRIIRHDLEKPPIVPQYGYPYFQESIITPALPSHYLVPNGTRYLCIVGTKDARIMDISGAELARLPTNFPYPYTLASFAPWDGSWVFFYGNNTWKVGADGSLTPIAQSGPYWLEAPLAKPFHYGSKNMLARWGGWTGNDPNMGLSAQRWFFQPPTGYVQWEHFGPPNPRAVCVAKGTIYTADSSARIWSMPLPPDRNPIDTAEYLDYTYTPRTLVYTVPYPYFYLAPHPQGLFITWTTPSGARSVLIHGSEVLKEWNASPSRYNYLTTPSCKSV